MSFGLNIKKELSMLNNLTQDLQVKYELIGYLLSSNVSEEKNKIKFSTESEYNINRFSKLLRNVHINDFKIDIHGKVYDISFNKREIKEKALDKIDWDAIRKIELIRALIRGCFMGSGSINNPENTYHLEIKFHKEEYIDRIIKILEEYDVNFKSIDKIIYIKDGEEISKFLAFIEAFKSVLKFEEIRVQRYMNNKVNRLVNCKTANLERVMNASAEQIAAIGKLKTSGKFQKLDEDLKELAELRLEHPDMPLSELGKMLSKPIGKSGVNYRLKKIIEVSKQ